MSKRPTLLRRTGLTPDRREPDPVTSELLVWITSATERIGRSADGLTEAQVRTPAAPSGWTIAGLIGHVHDSTWFWLHHVIAGNPMEFRGADGWDNDPDLPFPKLLAQLRDDTARGCGGHLVGPLVTARRRGGEKGTCGVAIRARSIARAIRMLDQASSAPSAPPISRPAVTSVG